MVSNGSEDERPVIGLPTYVEQTRFNDWDVPSAVLPHAYVAMVTEAGGIPVLLPPAGVPTPGLVRLLDGLVLTGGADIDPARYGGPAVESPGTRSDRDESEFGLFELGRAAALPILAVCRGLQLVNVAFGGTLIPHLPDVIGHEEHSGSAGGFSVTRVLTTAGSRVAELAGPEVKVSCHHHQAIDRLADGLVVTARAADGTIEAAEAKDGSFLVGVQWHPEVDSADRRLVRALVDAAATYRRERSA
ncbi:gamma-glutamyl-gamma-aminobutyrate hydrolase family protein [Nocardia sp. NPDC049190]|uniref:gamma-glutamyl-gamma-aminobutyrate hydrolase family protein n=1 Tax=Nocardia sp. NPDC049190 TaxID=3155650 RepID=UPI00340E2FB0